MDNKPYVKTLQDELDWKLLDQLYGVVAQISSFCFEAKKFCITTEFVVLTLMAKFTKDSLDQSFFIAALIIPLCFWFLDATGYFYQVKLRGTMESLRLRLSDREGNSLVTAQGAKIIAPERAAHSVVRRVLESGFNHSMWLYAVLVSAALIVWTLFLLKIIK